MSPETAEMDSLPFKFILYKNGQGTRTPETIVKGLLAIIVVKVALGNVNMLCAQACGLVVRHLSFVIADFCCHGCCYTTG